jgi:ribulose-bisphosphate carboxylase large chain
VQSLGASGGLTRAPRKGHASALLSHGENDFDAFWRESVRGNRLVARFTARYRVRGDAGSIEARAREIAVEQSVEMPLAAVRDPAIRADIVAEVASIADRGDGSFEVELALAAATVGDDAGQLLNMIFGNTSLHEDVALEDVQLPDEMLKTFGGPHHGLEGLRRRAKARGRALTCAALKPQGLPPAALAELAYELARGGVDFIKDDHGLADQAYSPFASRVPAIAKAVRDAGAITGTPTRYVPSLSGHFATIERQLGIARDEGLDAVMIAPAIAGVSTLQGLAAAHPEFAFITHPTMQGVRVAPALYAKLYRLFGADAAIFPNHGGRFGYSKAACAAIAAATRAPWGALERGVPIPAGGMNLARVPEMLRFYGRDVMLLIGGALLASPRENLAAETARFVTAVAEHEYLE